MNDMRKTKKMLLDEIAELRGQIAVTEHQEVADKVAYEMGYLREALMNQGFTREEAMSIVLRTIPGGK